MVIQPTCWVTPRWNMGKANKNSFSHGTDSGRRGSTLLCEVEAIINFRPISKACNDPLDLEPLTPNHLLLLKGKATLPPGLFSLEDCYAKRRWRQVQYMADLFWKRWTREYLPELQERQKWTKKRRNFVAGDIVLIIDDTAPRNS